jgi:hypothetical protein
MASRVRVHRLEAQEPLAPGIASRPRRPAWDVAARVAAAPHLDLGSRTALAGDLQASAGNGAVAQLVGLARTDHKTEPPSGVQTIIDASSPGNRGLTRSRYVGNPPIFRVGGASQAAGGAWQVKPVDVRLPSLDYDVYWPAPGRHRLGAYGKGTHYLDVTEEWSGKLGAGETEHVTDTDKAWEMTWGRVAAIINALAAGEPFTGRTVDAARDAAWNAFKSRLPEGLKPAGDTPDSDAQEAVWGMDEHTVFRRMMNETKRARDDGGWHTPDEPLKGMEGADRVDELAAGGSRIGQVTTDRLMQDAWTRITHG